MPQGNLVQTWLSTIGLSEQIIETFDAAGIVNPKDLAELEVNHFPALGVKDPGDRKKLFYLIQRVKMSVPNEDDEGRNIIQSTNSVKMMSNDRSRLLELSTGSKRRDQVESDEHFLDSFEKNEKDDDSLFQDVSDVPSDETPPSPRSPSKSQIGISRQKNGDKSPYANKREEMFLRRRNERLEQLSPRRSKVPSTDAVKDEMSDKATLSSDVKLQSSTDKGAPKRTSRSDDESSIPCASSSKPVVKLPTIASRLAKIRDKDSRFDGNSNEFNDSTGSTNINNNSRRPIHQKNNSVDDGVILQDKLVSETNVSSSIDSRERKSRLHNPNSIREHKRLSTIPAERPAIMSPLQVSSGEIDYQLKDDFSVVSESSASSRRSSNSRTRTRSADDRNRRQSIRVASRTKSNPKSRHNSATDSSPVRSRATVGDDLSDARSLNTDQKKGSVFVHGTKKDNSWASQIASLRDAQNHIHKLHMENVDIVPNPTEEMRIRVVIRKRPMSKSEMSKKEDIDVIHPLKYGDYGRILVYQPKTRVDLTKEVEPLPFAFDNVFDENSHNCQIYDVTIKPLIPGAFEGRWASVFAYGQTGSGKTFTMMGSTLTGIKARTTGVDHDKNLGLYVLAARDLFKFSKSKEYSHLSIGCSLFEIYGGRLFDLLNQRNQVKCLENHKGRVCFPGLSEHPISSADELMALIEAGSNNRSTGSTSANRDSSRSHAVLQLHIRKNKGGKSIEHGRLSFIDLAGSERGADTNEACRTTRLEGADINTSLLALKEVIRALATGDSMTHIPFRGSKLTQVLKESFVGKNARTVMVACVAPNMTNCDHTLNTLRYADRVKERNPDTGNLTAVVAEASQIDVRSQGKYKDASFAVADDDARDDDSWLSELDKGDGDEVYDSYGDFHDEGLDELNEVLKSPIATSHSERFFKEESHQRKGNTFASSKREAVQPLINTHRTIMTDMLSMVKQEMTLVNCTDADRELIEEYLDELEEIQDKQLNMISTLRESLVHYYATRPSKTEDGSFDDLRSPY